MPTFVERGKVNNVAKAPKTVGARVDRTIRQAKLAGKQAARFAGKHKAALIASGIGLTGAAAAGAIGYKMGKKSEQKPD